MRQAHIGLRLGGVGLRHTKVRRGQLRQQRATFNLLAHVRLDRHHAACKGWVNALGALFVPDQFGGQLYRDGFARCSRCHAQQGKLGVIRRKAQLACLQNGRGRFWRGGGGFGAGTHDAKQREA